MPFLMRVLETLLALRPMLLRRLFLILFAGPILIATMLLQGGRRAPHRLEYLCGRFDTAWGGNIARLADG